MAGIETWNAALSGGFEAGVLNMLTPAGSSDATEMRVVAMGRLQVWTRPGKGSVAIA
jgi:hypothetical protein